MTPTLYNERFSFENLDATPSVISGQENVSIAEVYGVEDDVPSDRPLGEGFVDEPRSFNEILWWHIAGPH